MLTPQDLIVGLLCSALACGLVYWVEHRLKKHRAQQRPLTVQLAGMTLGNRAYRVTASSWRGKTVVLHCTTRTEAENDARFMRGAGWHSVNIKELT